MTARTSSTTHAAATMHAAVRRVATLDDLGLTPARAAGLHRVAPDHGGERVQHLAIDIAAGRLRVLHVAFGLLVAIDASDDLERAGRVMSCGWAGDEGPLVVRQIGRLRPSGALFDVVDELGAAALPLLRVAR